MQVKTYGVPGLAEWHGKLKAGSIEVKVSFVGGTSSPSGAQPAYMATKDPITQFVIEHSKEFKSGFIILVMSQTIPGTHPRMAIPKSPGDVVCPTSEDVPPTTQDSRCIPSSDDGSESQGLHEGGAMSGDVVCDGVGTDGVIVHVTDKQDAIEYLKEHFPEKGYTSVKLRTKIAFEAACLECGVVFVFAS